MMSQNKDVSRLRAMQSVAAAMQAKFGGAVAALQQGKFADAERVFQEILRQYPNHFDAQYGLGVVAAQTGRTDRAAELFRKAIKLDPKAANAHRSLGVALKDLKRPKDALGSFDKAIALKPDYAECHSSRGLALQDLRMPADALAAFDRAIALKSYFPEAHYNRGIALQELGRPAEALAAHEKAIEQKPFFPEAFFNRGVVLEQLMRPDDALASYGKAVALKPDFPEALTSRGNILHEQRHLEEALACHDKAIALRPDFAEAHNNRGIVLMHMMRPIEALTSCDKAIALKPDFAEAYNNRGNILQDLARYDDALAAFDKAIEVRPGYAEAYSNKSHLLLLMGKFGEGWRLYEARKTLPNPVAPSVYAQPLWLGEEDIAGKTVLLWWEQGFGDTIQFCRYVTQVEARGAKVLMLVQEPLRKLLRQLSPTITFVDPDTEPTGFDFHCPLMSLPLALSAPVGAMLEAIPSERGYIKADAPLRAAWEARLPPKMSSGKAKPRIGAVWSGSSSHKIYNRSMPLDTYRGMLEPNADWICLQKEIGADDLAALRSDGRITFFGDELRDFSDTAALLDCMDLVITIDTSLAHLAGAMGKPVWVLLPYNANWRWLLNRNDSPWYPSVRLFRQSVLDRWDNVIEEVKTELRAFAD